MKLLIVATMLVAVIVETSVANRFQVLHSFDDRVANPLSTVVHDGVIFGIADALSEPVEIPVFAFELATQGFRFQDLPDDIRGLGTLAPGAGPLTVAGDRFWGTYDFSGDSFAISLSDLSIGAKFATSDPNVTQPNPVLVGNVIAAPAQIGTHAGVRFLSLDGTLVGELALQVAPSPIFARTLRWRNLC